MNNYRSRESEYTQWHESESEYTQWHESEALKPRLACAAGAYPGFRSMKRLVHRRSLPRNFVRFPQQFAGTHLYSWVERGTVRVKRLAQEHNTVSPARARTRTARTNHGVYAVYALEPGDERTNHEATAPPQWHEWSCLFLIISPLFY